MIHRSFFYSFAVTIMLCNCREKSSNITSDISAVCAGSDISYLGVKMKYPLTVDQAKREYKLQFRPQYYFFTTVPGLPKLSTGMPFNFNIIFPLDKYMAFDRGSEEMFSERPVKGYTFLFQGSTNSDSLKAELEKQFGGKFITKGNKSTQSLKMNRGLFYHEMKVSECIHIAMSDYGPQKRLILLCFYFDIPEQERQWLPS